jgi:hypothetical protein
MDISYHSEPRPVAPRMSPAGVFAIVGGPLAWFFELNAGYALASGPCFPGAQRLIRPLPGFSWSTPLLIVLLVVCTLVAFAAFWTSWRDLRKTRDSASSTSREHFAAVWGTALGGGFCIATLVTAVGLILLPRCMG